MATGIFALQKLRAPTIPMLVLLTFLRVCEGAAKKKKGGGRSSKPKNDDDDDYLEITDSPKKGSTIVIALIAVSILLALAIGAFYIYCMHHKKHEDSETGNSKPYHNTGQGPAASYGVPPNPGNVTHERPFHSNLPSHRVPGNVYRPPDQQLGGHAGQENRLPAAVNIREVRPARSAVRPARPAVRPAERPAERPAGGGRRDPDRTPLDRSARREPPDVESGREESRREESSPAESLVLEVNDDEDDSRRRDHASQRRTANTHFRPDEGHYAPQSGGE